MINQNILFAVLVLGGVAIFAIGGCVNNGSQLAEMKEVNSIDVGVRNLGTERIEDATVSFGNYLFSFGIVSPGKKAVHVCSGQMVPATAEIVFELQNGKVFKKVVSVRENLPTEDRGSVILHFNIDSNQDVGVEFFRSEKVDGRSKLVPY